LLVIVSPFVALSGAAHPSAVVSSSKSQSATRGRSDQKALNRDSGAAVDPSVKLAVAPMGGTPDTVQFKLHANGKARKNCKDFRALTVRGGIAGHAWMLTEAAP
jgi:hypothetical protein